jgi:hypothetical protein
MGWIPACFSLLPCLPAGDILIRQGLRGVKECTKSSIAGTTPNILGIVKRDVLWVPIILADRTMVGAFLTYITPHIYIYNPGGNCIHRR